MRVVDALVNEDKDELMQRVLALKATGQGDQGMESTASGWCRVYGAEALEALEAPCRLTYQSDALRIAEEPGGVGQ